jgi:hypothetical protein
MAAGYSNLNIALVDGLVDTLSKYLYSLAGIVEGDRTRCSTYLDAADCLMDVLAMWKEDEDAA